MELSRLLRIMRGRWTLIAIVSLLGVIVAMLATEWLNRRSEPIYQATATVTHLTPTDSRSSSSDLQALMSLALLANTELLGSDNRASIDTNEETNQILFIASASNSEKARETVENMRRAFNEADPANEEPLIRARLDEIVVELESIDAETVTTDPAPQLGSEVVILTAQIDALRVRLGDLATEFATTPVSPETEEQRSLLQVEMDQIGERMAALQAELAAMGGTVDIGTEAELEQSALQIYSSDLISEYQTLYLRLLGRNPTTRDESITVIDQTPQLRSISLMGALGAVAGSLLGVALLVMADTVRRRIWVRSDFEPLTPALLEMPPRRSTKPPSQPWYPNGRPGPRKRGVQTLRSQLSAASEGPTAIGIVDLGAGAIQVARLTDDLGAAIAAAGNSVLIIDANLQQAKSPPELRHEGYRLSDVLTHRSDDEEELRSLAKRAVGDQTEVLSGLRVLSSGSVSGDRVDALAGRQMSVLLQEARAAYETVLVATSSESDPASLAIIQQLDLLIFVTRAGRTPVARIKRADKDLSGMRPRVLGGTLLVGRSASSRKAQKKRSRRSGPRGPRGSARHLPTGTVRNGEGTRSRRTKRGRASPQQARERRKAHQVIGRKIAKTLFATIDLFLRRYPGPRILIYHEVGDISSKEMSVPAQRFRRQLDWLQARGHIVSLEEALSRVREPEAHRLFVLSFDDGYQDLYSNVFPLLLEKQIPFTLYLTTEPVESGRPLAQETGTPPLTWSQVEEMLRSGLMTLGSHTHRHPDFRYASALAITQELDLSDALFEERLGVRPRHFAYPWGYWSETAEPLIKERFATAVLGGGPPVKGETTSHRIHRMPIQRSDGMFFFRRRVKKGLRLEEFFRRRLRRYDGPPRLPIATA